jgi:hypothetical protein
MLEVLFRKLEVLEKTLARSKNKIISFIECGRQYMQQNFRQPPSQPLPN